MALVDEESLTPSPALLKVLDGAVDLHCHSGPSPFPRRIDHVDASYDGARIGMRAILVKSHHHNTAMDVLAMRKPLADAPTPVYGGVALNTEVGGVNPSAVALTIGMGGRCVWGPTVSAAQHVAAHSHDDGFPTTGGDLHEKIETVLGEDGDVSEAADTVTRLAADARIMITGGHMDGEQIRAYFHAAHRNGVKRLLLHHPDFIVNTPDSVLDELVGLGAFVEHEIAMYHPGVSAPRWPIQRLVDWIERIGPDHTVIDSDLGQDGNPLPVDGYLYIAEQLLEHGVAERDIRQMICRNTAYLLGLEETR